MATRKGTKKVATRARIARGRSAKTARPSSPSRAKPSAGPRDGVAQPPTTPRSEAPSVSAPSAIGCLAQHFDFTSHAMDEMRRFYTEKLGFTDFTHDPHFNYLRIVTASGASLGFMPPMPGPPEQWRPPREPALYFMVEDVDGACSGLKARGVTLQQEPTTMPWNHRVAVLKDPEGRLIMLAQDLKA